MNKLDLSRIQTASPYDIEEVANGVYLFETDHDVLYKIEFGEDASVVLYVCDTSDGRQRKRSLLFQRWFQEYDHAEQFTVLFGCIRDEDTDNYVGIIVERTNPKYQSVIDDFNETLEMFHANKPA